MPFWNFSEIFKTVTYKNTCERDNFVYCFVTLCKLTSLFQRLNLNPVSIYLLKVNNRSTRTRCEICSKSAIKTQNDASGVVLVSLLLTLNIFHTFS